MRVIMIQALESKLYQVINNTRQFLDGLYFVSDHCKYKMVNKVTCKIPSAKSCNILHITHRELSI